jgi:K+/H+ antiporter YhaU regulatory subunit KhtT
MVHYSNPVALTLFKMHRETAIEADSEMPLDDLAELREKISNKLDRLKQQEDRREAETGSGGRRIADVEARAAIGAIFAALRSHGLILS